MPAISSVFLVIAFVLAVMIGPQTRPWTWGPGLLALGISVSAALPVFWKKNRPGADFGLLAFGLLVAGWFAWRAWLSPVAELGEADLMLLAGVAGTFISLRAIEGNNLAEQILVWGIALLLLANVLVVGKQVHDPSFSPLFRSRPTDFPSGFYAHYNEAANYLIASSLLLAAAALFGTNRAATRLIWALIAVSGLAAVYFTRSRGGILGAAVGAGAFAVLTLVIARRRKARWFAPAVIAIPVIGLLLSGFVYTGWMGSQEIRLKGSGISEMMDNNSRLYLWGIAMSCVALHPIAGGGSRSFSWECFRFFESKLQGDIITHKPEQVHNELIQAATDYGLIGAGLLIGLLGAVVLVAIIRVLFAEPSRESDSGDAWRLGGLAALAGMFVQSCFSFVFHLLPGILLLGICLGLLVRTAPSRVKTPQIVGSKILLTAAALACVALLFPLAWKGTRLTNLLWNSYFSKNSVTLMESRTDALTEAIRIWPQSSLYQERAAIYQEVAASEETAKSERVSAAGQAIKDYQQAGLLHPYDPSPAINRANLLSQLKQDSEAEDAYDLAIRLQGGMEPGFRAHFSLANHLMQKGVRQFNADDPGPALASLEVAAQQFEEAVKAMHWITRDMIAPRVAIHESLGAAREASGDYKGAMEAYDFTTKLEGGSEAHYRAGVLNGKMAAAAWSGRHPAEALGYFMEAKKRVFSSGSLPQGVTPSERLDYATYLDRTIAYLRGAKIEPALTQ